MYIYIYIYIGSWVLCVVQSYNWLAHACCVWSRVISDRLMCVVCGPELQLIGSWVLCVVQLQLIGSWVLCVVQSYNW